MNFGALFLRYIGVAQKAVDDIKANEPRPAAPAMTGAQISSIAADIKADLPGLQAWCAARPGAFTALDDLLVALEADGFTWARTVRNLIDAVPGGLDEIETLLPTVLFFLGGAFTPAPTWQPGPGPYRGR